MAKLTLTDITAGQGASTTINANNTLAEAALENTVSLDGTAPNAMSANFDMNGFNILNQGNPITITGFDFKGSWLTATAYIIGDVIENGGTGYVAVEAHTSGTFATDLTAVKWQLLADADLPTQVGQSGKFLTTNGTTASWGDVATSYLLLTGGTLTGPLTSVGITDTGIVDLSGATIAGGSPLVFEGATADAFETTFIITDPTADRTITFPDADISLGSVISATTAAEGLVELATTAELQTGTDTTRAVTVQALRQGFSQGHTLEATTSGTSFTKTGIPSWATQVIVTFANCGLNGTNNLQIQLGDSGGIETTGYNSASCKMTGGGYLGLDSTDAFSTTAFHITTASLNINGSITFTLHDSATNHWASQGCYSGSASNTFICSGQKALSSALTQIKLLPTSSNTFDSGSWSVSYS